MIRKLFATFIALFIIFIFVACNAEKSKNLETIIQETTEQKSYAEFDKNNISDISNMDPHGTDDNGNDSYNEELAYKMAKANGWFIKIEDFHIETDDSIPLKTTKLNTNEFSSLISVINTTNHMSSDCFRLYHLIGYDEWLAFRETKLNSNQYYYCIIENEDNENKAYLFFSPCEDTWKCNTYALIDNSGNLFDYRNGEETVSGNDEEMLINSITNVDLK